MKKVVVLGLGGLRNWGENFLIDCARFAVEQREGFCTEEGDLEPAMTPARKLVYYSMISAARAMPDRRTSVRIEYAAVRFRCAKSYEKAMEGADAVIFGAGSFKYGTQKLWAYYSLAVEIARARGIPVMFNAMNVQKYDPENPKCRFLAVHAGFPNVRMITTRDDAEGVRRLRKDYGVGRRVPCRAVGDMAYWIPECYGVRRRDGGDTIGINILAGSNFRRYGHQFTEEQMLDLYCEVLRILDEKGLRWKLFINGIASDRKFARKLTRRLHAPALEAADPRTATEMLEMIASFRVILGGRLHTCISAYALDVPVVGFYWDEKMNRFARLAKIEDLFYSEARMEGAAIAEKLAALYRDGYTYDRQNRDYWKGRTMDCLGEFLDGI